MVRAAVSAAIMLVIMLGKRRTLSRARHHLQHQRRHICSSCPIHLGCCCCDPTLSNSSLSFLRSPGEFWTRPVRKSRWGWRARWPYKHKWRPTSNSHRKGFNSLLTSLISKIFSNHAKLLEHLPTVGPVVVINIHKTWYNIPLPDFREQADALRIAASHGVRIWIRYA